MTTISRSQQATATMKLALIAAATVGVAIGLPATAHANGLSKFASPSGNIRCAGSGGAGFVVCEIRDYTYVVPNNDITGCQDSRWPRGNVVEIATGGTDWTCPGTEFDSGPWPTLDYGQTRSLGPITCDSEPSGMTCTDSRSGHFFRVSRDSYRVG